MTPPTGELIILIFHQAIHIPYMMNKLLPPMQIRLNDMIVNDQPKFLAENPSDDTHTIIFSNSESKDGKNLTPLSLKGVTSTFPTQKPTVEDCKICKKLELTFESHEYDTLSTCYEEQEDALLKNLVQFRETWDILAHARCLCSVFQSLTDVKDVSEESSQSNVILRV